MSNGILTLTTFAVSSFGTLTFKQIKSINYSMKSRNDLESVAGGGVHDHWGTDAAPLIPGTVTVKFRLHDPSRATLNTYYATMSTFIGRRGTLNGSDIGSVSRSCTARLIEMSGDIPEDFATLKVLDVTAVFQQLTVFA